MKILFIGPNDELKYNVGHHKFKLEIAKQHQVTWYGKDWPKYDLSIVHVRDILKIVPNKYDVIMTYFYKRILGVRGLGGVTNIPKVHFVMDLVEKLPGGGLDNSDQIEKSFAVFNRDKYDIYFCVDMRSVNILKKNGFDNIHLLPFSVDINWFDIEDVEKIRDVYFGMSMNPILYPNRLKIKEMLVKKFRRDQLVTSAIKFAGYPILLRKSKILINSVNYWKSVNYKILEASSCGTMVLTDKPDELDNYGLIDGEHLVIYNGVNDLEEKLNYYLSHDEERELIAKTGCDFVREHHNTNVRVKQMTQIMENNLP